MSTKLQLKICGLSHPETIAEITALAPDFMGFIFYPQSPRYLEDSEERQQLIDAIPACSKKVGVFVNEELDTVIRRAQQYGLDYIQLHGDESPEYARHLNKKGLKVIKVFRISDSFPQTLADFEDCADYFLFDTDCKQYGGSGHQFDWSLLKEYPSAKTFFLSGGLSLDDIDSIGVMNLPQLSGIDVNSRFEIAPGHKDSNKLRALISMMRNSNEHKREIL